MNQALSTYSLDYADQESLRSATDKALLKQVRSGNTAAFEQLFTRYESRLVGYATRYIGSPDLAQDICQEVFLKVITKPPRVLMSESLAPWLFRVTRNLAIDKRRRLKFEVHNDESTFPEARDESDPLQELAQKSDAAMVRELVNQLPEDLRDVVELRIHGGVSFKEIAAILRIPQGTALWRMHRAVELLRKSWRRHGA